MSLATTANDTIDTYLHNSLNQDPFLEFLHT